MSALSRSFCSFKSPARSTSTTRPYLHALSMGLLFGTLLIVSACSSAPPEHFYMLDAAPTNAGPIRPDASTVSIGPITVPDAVDRAQMVIRKSTSEVEQREDRRWAEPLRNAIARALSRDLGAALPDMVTSVRSDSAVDPHPNYRVAVDFLRFDSELGAAATIEARWRIQSDGKQVLTGQFERREPTTGADYADLASAHARALAGLSQQVAKALRTLTTPK